MKAIQQPLDRVLTEHLLLRRDQLPPDDLLQEVASPPSDELIQSIAVDWIINPIIVVADPSTGWSELLHETYSRGWEYYPIAGHRRTLAVSYLMSVGWKDPVSGLSADQNPIPAILMKGTDVSQGLRYIYKTESTKTDNRSVDAMLVMNEATRLGISVFDEGASKMIAKSLGTPKRASIIGKIIKTTMLDAAIFQALRSGKISDGVFLDACGLEQSLREEVGRRLGEGKKVTAKDIHELKTAVKLNGLKEQAEASESFDFNEFSQPELSTITIPRTMLEEWVKLLVHYKETEEMDDIGWLENQFNALLQEK